MKLNYFSLSMVLFFLTLISCGKEEELESFNDHPLPSLSHSLLEKLSFNTYDSKAFHALKEEDSYFINYLFYMSKIPSEWLLLVDKNHKLPSYWAPEDLTNLSEAGIPTHRKDIMIRSSVIPSLKEIIEEAKKEGINLSIVSAYRDIPYQERVWQYNLEQYGIDYTQDYIAEPGSSQHHLGSVVDFNLADEAFDDSPEALWLEKNASGYGWSLSYPKGYENQTSYQPESWHFRYFPEEISLFIDKYFDGLQFAFLEFWHRNSLIIKETLKEYQES